MSEWKKKKSHPSLSLSLSLSLSPSTRISVAFLATVFVERLVVVQGGRINLHQHEVAISNECRMKFSKKIPKSLHQLGSVEIV